MHPNITKLKTKLKEVKMKKIERKEKKAILPSHDITTVITCVVETQLHVGLVWFGIEYIPLQTNEYIQ